MKTTKQPSKATLPKTKKAYCNKENNQVQISLGRNGAKGTEGINENQFQTKGTVDNDSCEVYAKGSRKVGLEITNQVHSKENNSSNYDHRAPRQTTQLMKNKFFDNKASHKIEEKDPMEVEMDVEYEEEKEEEYELDVCHQENFDDMEVDEEMTDEEKQQQAVNDMQSNKSQR